MRCNINRTAENYKLNFLYGKAPTTSSTTRQKRGRLVRRPLFILIRLDPLLDLQHRIAEKCPRQADIGSARYLGLCVADQIAQPVQIRRTRSDLAVEPESHGLLNVRSSFTG